MESLLNVSPGAIIWTIINFCIFLFIIVKFGGKPILNGLKARENRIINEIQEAENKNENAKQLLMQAQEKIDSAQKDMLEIISKGKKQAEDYIHKAAEEAERIKRVKVQEAIQEIERNKDVAIKELRTQVAQLVVEATEKILEEKLDTEHQYKLIESYLEKIPKN
jgi:F-type H+-transporting ATPase subunit b